MVRVPEDRKQSELKKAFIHPPRPQLYPPLMIFQGGASRTLKPEYRIPVIITNTYRIFIDPIE